MKIIHTSDIHFDRENQEAALASLQALYQHGRTAGVDLWVIAGDLFNRAVANTEAAGFPRLIVVLQAMMNMAPMVAVQGTPTHDIPGCYEALQEISAKFSFTLLDPRIPYFLNSDGQLEEYERSEESPVERPPARLLILGCGEPSKEWFLRDKEGLGRDEATQAVITGMRQLLLGLGAIRKQYADIPCLMVYHGAVEGASLANGQTLPPGELAIGRDDLALVGADYYALGHIHLAQQISGLPAYYSGSAYPCNWGEVDQKGFYSFELNTDMETQAIDVLSFGQSIKGKLTRVPFPHPPRKKIVRDWPESPTGEERGFQTWIVYRASKEVAAQIHIEATLEGYLETAGVLPGSRVTVEIIPTETVRAGQISEARGLAAKLAIYAENSGEALTEGVLAKASTIEAEARASGQVGEGLYIRIDRLRLRGAIGVWKGLGLDEINLDLGRYDEGLVALVGPNGAGKTTLIENMHPYAEMLTRQGKLQDHFRLKDSYRDLHFTDERTGQAYRALIQVDGANASGRAEYHLYRDGQPLTNGRKDEYDKTIEQLFGSLALFVRSAFVSQKPPKGHPDLTDATKGEKKALFRELAGQDYLQVYSETGREEAKALEAETERDAGRAEALEGMLSGREGKIAELAAAQADLRTRSLRLLSIESDGKAAKVEVEELRQKVERNREIEQRLRELEMRENKLTGEAELIEASRTGYEEALAGRPQAEKVLAEIAALKEEEAKLHAEQAGILKERERLSNQHRDAQRVVEDQRRKIEATQTALDREAAVLAQKKQAAVRRVDELEAQLATLIECPACHHRFHPDAEPLRAKIAQAQEEGFEADKGIEAIERQQEALAKDKILILDPPTLELPVFDDSQMRMIAGKLAALNEPATRKALAAAQEAEVRIQESLRRKAAIGQELGEIAQIAQHLKGQLLGPELEKSYELKQMELSKLEAQYRDCRDEVKRLEASITALEKQLAELAEREAELAALREALEAKRRDAAEWRWLERACGPDGVQALELDAMGPGIAEVANRLLAAAYGSRFQVEFRTTRIGGAGSKKKQIEDFQIWILDSEHGTEQLLETLSGGEAVWIKRAIYDAFGIIRDRSTGQRFLTCFQDEADGALDPEARLAYFRMLEAAHLEAGRRHTLVITHSQEAQEMIAQRIRMQDLQAAAEADAVEAAR